MLIVGAGARHQLVDHVRRIGSRRILIVTDRYLVQSGAIAEIEQPLRAADIAVAIFDDVQPDPTVDNVNNGLEVFFNSQSELIVGFGGGSPMDAAKAISVLTTNALPLSQYMGYHKIPQPGCPLILIPTTAGTGSEATKVAVITDTQRSLKMMILDANLQADMAIVDYELSVTMPQTLTAHVGVDTLSHGIEAYVSRKANPLTDPIALSCVRLCGKFLLRAYKDGSDLEARQGMMTAALQGGMAFSNSSVCLIHGMSRPIGAHFHLTHGLSNAVLLPAVTSFSLESAKSRYADIAIALDAASPQNSIDEAAASLVPWLEELNRQCSIPLMKSLVSDYVSYQNRWIEMAQSAIDSGSPANNPRVPTHEQIIDIYKSIW